MATYGDSWFEPTYRVFAGVIGALPKRAAPTLVDYGPMLIVSEGSAEAPPWRGKVDGALVHGSTAGDVRAFADWLRRGEVPTVAMVSDLLDTGVPSVCADYRELGRIAAIHLARDCGCRSFLHVGIRGTMSTARREEGFHDALAAIGQESQAIQLDFVPLSERYEPQQLAVPQLDKLLRGLPRPIGLFAMVDSLAASVADRCKRLGLHVPQDVAVLGVGNTLRAHTHSPSLSSIRVRHPEVGAAAMRLLTDMMRGEPPPSAPVLIGGCELFARTSTIGPEERGTVLTVDVAMERIQASACAGLTVEQLAESLRVSRRTLELLFQRQRGNSPGEEIQRVRFEKAALMLRFTTRTITQIAGLTGFGFRPGFCKFFKRMSGMTPLEYRVSEGGYRPPRPGRRRRA